MSWWRLYQEVDAVWDIILIYFSNLTEVYDW